MKKLLLVAFGAAALTFQSCIGKDETADKNKTIDDGMESSETTLGSGSTRPADVHRDGTGKTAGHIKSSTTEGFDTTNTETGSKPVETGSTPGVKENMTGKPNYKKEDKGQ
jgi:hypothetical protein